MRCDSEGVPELVQRIRYSPDSMYWTFVLFNGDRRTIAEEFCDVQGIGLMTIAVSPQQIEDARTWFNRRWLDEDFRARMELSTRHM